MKSSDVDNALKRGVTPLALEVAYHSCAMVELAAKTGVPYEDLWELVSRWEINGERAYSHTEN